MIKDIFILYLTYYIKYHIHKLDILYNCWDILSVNLKNL